MADLQPFFVDRAKGGRASCKGCKGNCPSGELRIAKVVASPYGENQTMKSWHHVDCFMNALLKQRPATKRVDSIDDIGNWETLSKEDQEFLIKKFNETEKLYEEKYSGKYTAKVLKNESAPKNIPASSPANQSKNLKKEQEIVTEDNKFNNFFKLCKKISKVDAYTEKTATVNNFFRKGTDGESFKGDLALWCKLLLPQVCKRVYNLKSKQLVKLFSRIFNLDHDDMLTHLEQGDVAETIQHFFSKSRSVTPASESTLTIHNIEDFLQELSTLTKEEEQTYHFKKIVKKCTENDLKMLIRLIKGDLRINAGPKHILEGVHPDAYTAFQTSRDLNMVIERILSDSTGIKHKDAIQKSVKAKITIMTPVLPMLAEACKSVEMAMKKCPNGMFSEIKYDGERVQVHKKGNEFKYFSRALKPVMPHKVSHFKDYLPQAFPKGEDMILDAEVLMVDVNTGKPLPFGTLGIHKQSEFKDAQVCLFIFDCLYYNGQVLLDVPIRKRRKFLLENMVEVKNHIMFSEQQLIKKPADLAKMIAEVLQLGLEGLVLKDLESTYEPGKRHWLKVKKDYLFDGKMADTADLVVLGAWFGTGKKGGMMSVFLMGCLDKRRNKWVTVTKVHTGHDDSTLERLQKELNPLMSKISQDYHKVPSWLDCNKGMVPDYVAIDPKKQPVWEITGTEFTKANIHTADGISVRFPRVTKIRDDKNWESATNLDELKHLFKTSKEKTDVSLLNKIAATATDESQNKKVKEEKSPVKNKGKDKLSPKGMGTLDSFVIKKESKKIKEESSSKKVSLESSLDTKNYSFESDTKKGKLKEIKSERLSSDESMNESVDHNKKKDRDSKKRKLKEIKDEKSSSNDDINDSTSDRKKDKDGKKRKLKDLEESSSFKDLDEVDSKKKRKFKDIKDEQTSSDSIDSDRKKDSKKRKSKNDESSSHKSEKESKKDKRKSDQLKISDSSSDTIIYDLDDNVTGVKDIADQDVIDDVTSDKDVTADRDVTADKDITDDEDDIGYPENPFPDLFLDKRLGFYPDFISFTEEERDIYERHWIAYGGIVVKTIKYMDVDYVLHRDEEISLKDMKLLRKKIPEGVIHVNKFWLNKCINHLECVDTKHYAVFVNP